MDVSSIASLATNLSETSTNQAVGIAVLKKALNIESAGAVGADPGDSQCGEFAG